MKRFVALLVCVMLTLSMAHAAIIRDEDAPVFPVRLPDGTYDTAAPMPFSEKYVLDELEIYCIRVTVCDAFLIRCHGETMMIDGGMFQNGAGTRNFLNAVQAAGVDYLFNTHHHEDHLGMQKFLMKNGFHVGEFLTPYERNYPVQTQREAEQIVDQMGIPYHTISDGDEMMLGGQEGAHLQFFRWSGSTNANFSSMMCKITYKERSIFFMADVSSNAQKALAAERPDIPWKSDILKAGHHGYTEQIPALLEMIDPQFVIMTNSRQGGKATYNQMNRLGIPVAMTPSGTIYLHTDGKNDWHYTQGDIK